MEIKEIFDKQIDKKINGVIHADDTSQIENEVHEYVFTNEIEQRLENFFDAYRNYVEFNGAWISGFFGSGKSHLLKMLAIMLENSLVIDGKPVAECFKQKCNDNDILKGDIEYASKIPSKSILFNIASVFESMSDEENNSLLSAFVRVFDKSCGYFELQPYIAKFERELDEDGFLDAFKAKFKSVAGVEWEEGRKRQTRYSSIIDSVYNEVTGASSNNVLETYRNTYRLTIEDFAHQVKKYIDKQEPNFRLNFFVDEVGQKIANNVNLMLDLQTIVENLATVCKGRSWVIVTAQDDMSTIFDENSDGQYTNDYTKIQARFKNRLKLTSKDVAEVIQKRLLSKKTSIKPELKTLYDKHQDVFKTLFDFSDGSQTFKNFEDDNHFINSYPFIPYQFTLFQMAIKQLSDNKAFEGKFTAVGERSLLEVFQYVAVEMSKYNVGELATFDRMFDGIATSLTTPTQGPINRAEANLDNKFAVKVLKALLLVKYIKGFKGTVRNIAVLMYPNFSERQSELIKKVQEALNLLEQESYIQRTGEIYEYLTKDETDIENEIKNRPNNRDKEIETFQKFIFDGIIKDKRIKYGETNRSYDFSRKLDGKLLSPHQYELSINVISPLNLNPSVFDNALQISMQPEYYRDLLVVLKPDAKLTGDLSLYQKTLEYVGEKSNSQQKESVMSIIRAKREQNNERYRKIQQQVESLVSEARFYIGGFEIEISGENPQIRLIKAFNELITRKYTNLNLEGVNHNVKEDDIAKCFDTSQMTLFTTDAVAMTEAEKDILGSISMNTTYRTSVKDIIDKYSIIPYGWSNTSILYLVAKLCARGKIEIKKNSNILETTEIADLLKKTNEWDNLLLQAQMAFSQSQIRNLKNFYDSYANEPLADTDAKSLALATADLIKDTYQKVENLLKEQYKYPFFKVLNPALENLENCKGKAYTWYLTEFNDDQDKLISDKDNLITPIENFKNGKQAEIYNEATEFINSQKPNFNYISSEIIEELNSIMQDSECYKGTIIQDLKAKVDKIKSIIDDKLYTEKNSAYEKLEDLKKKLEGMEEYSKLSNTEEIIAVFQACKENISKESLIATVKDIVSNFENNEYRNLINLVIENSKPKVEVQNDDTSVAVEQPKKQEYVQAQKLSLTYSKPIVSDETQLNEYINSLKNAMLEQIKDGKIIQV